MDPDTKPSSEPADDTVTVAEPVPDSGAPALDEHTLTDAEPQDAFESELEHQQLGRYVVTRRLGHGGMGSVFEAFDRTLDRRVAVKVLRRDVAHLHAERLVREAKALAQLSHPNVVQVYEVGELGGQTFIAMELVHGQTLKQWAERQPRPGWRECLQTYVQAGEGLAAAHAQGFVHRDFKPSNAIVDGRGRVKVLDFGLARRADETMTTAPLPWNPEGPLDSPLTQTGMVMGTPAYMPLEQMRGQEADARSDQFAFCVALYEALYGQRPFGGGSMTALIAAVSDAKIDPPPRGSTVPAAVRQIVVKGLARDAKDRWSSMEELLTALRRQLDPRGRKWLLGGLAGGLVVAGVGLALYAEVGLRCEGAAQQLDGIWDDTRRAELRAALLGTEVAHAPATVERVHEQLDHYAEGWVAAHTATCEATRVTEQQSPEVMALRMACLSTRRMVLDATVEVLAQSSTTRVDEAVEMVAELPSLRPCDDVEALQADVAPPSDPAVAAQLEPLRAQLARARSLSRAGADDAAMALAQQAVDRADALGYPPLQAEARLQRGDLHRREDRYDDAVADLEAAYLTAARHRHESVEARAVAGLIHTVGIGQGNFAAGLQWGKTALVLAQARADPDLEAGVLASMGSLFKRNGDLDQALEHYERALAIREHNLGPDHLQVARSLNNMASVVRRQGQLQRALELHERSLAIREQSFGPEHPVVSSSLNNMANVLASLGRDEQAQQLYERALAIREQSYGPRSTKVATTAHNLAALLSLHGKHPRARALAQRSVDILDSTLGADHYRTVGARCILGDVLEAAGELEAAEQQYDDALDSFTRTQGADNYRNADPLLGLARIAMVRQDTARAVDHAERAVTLLDTERVSPAEVALARFVLAQALWAEPSERSRARTLAQQAQQTPTLRPSDQERMTAWLAEHPAAGASPG